MNIKLPHKPPSIKDGMAVITAIECDLGNRAAIFPHLTCNIFNHQFYLVSTLIAFLPMFSRGISVANFVFARSERQLNNSVVSGAMNMPLFLKSPAVGMDERLVGFQHLRNGRAFRRIFPGVRQG
jgi:hypothetical protein